MGDDSTKGVDEDKIVQGPKKWFDTFQKLSKAKRTKIKKVQADMLII